MMRRADIISAGVIVAFGLFVLLVAIPRWVPGHLEGNYGLRAQDFPILTALTLTLLALGLLVHRIGQPRRGEEENNPIPASSWRFLGLASGVLVAIWLLLDIFGFAAGGPFTIAAFMIVMGERRPLHVVALSLLAPLAVWLLFWQILKFPLP
jgi:ABC-type Co2+ transport system permease subunit